MVPFGIQLWFLNLPSWLNTRYWDQTLWQWIILGISLLIVFWIPYKHFRWNLRRIAALDPPQRTWQKLLSPIITVASLAAVSYFIDEWVNITGDVSLLVLIPLGIIFWMLVALTIFLLSNALAETIINSPQIDSRGVNAGGIRIVFRLLSLVICVIILILGFERVGISLTPILAGLGIGGAALALAGQKSIENIWRTDLIR